MRSNTAIPDGGRFSPNGPMAIYCLNNDDINDQTLNLDEFRAYPGMINPHLPPSLHATLQLYPGAELVHTAVHG